MRSHRILQMDHHVAFREGEAPAELITTAGRRPPEAFVFFEDASGGRRAKARFRLPGNLIPINGNACGASSSFTTHSAKPELRTLGGSLALPIADPQITF